MKCLLTMQDNGITEIYDLLYRLGLTANYNGFFYISYAVWLAMKKPERLLLVTKWLYPDVAKMYKTTWKAVERGIRSCIAHIWMSDPECLRRVLSIPVYTKPTPAKFISILSVYCAVNIAA